ncbi:MAG: hypothetical protein ACREA7_02515 [Nitrosotalea sp.]
MEIKCIEKTGTLVTGIYGIIASQSSNTVPTEGKFRAIDEAKSPGMVQERTNLVSYIE